MIQEYSDQVKIFNPDEFGYDIHFVGAGGACNSAIVQVACMGAIERATIHIWDPDYLEEHNMATELAYSNNMIGQRKVDAAADALRYKLGDEIVILYADELEGYDGPRPQVVLHPEAVTEDTELSGIVVTGVDSMRARQEIWQAIKRQFWQVPLLIDLRSSGLSTLIVTFSPSDLEAAESYEETFLYTDEQAMQLACGARNVCFISAYFGAEVAYRISLFARGKTAELEDIFSTPMNFI